MKRVVKIEKKYNDDLNDLKYVLQQEYEGFGIYQEMCPSGYYHHQSYLLINEDIAIICHSFMNMCKEELLDMVDSYKKTNNFGVKGFFKGEDNGLKIYVAHNNGKVAI